MPSLKVCHDLGGFVRVISNEKSINNSYEERRNVGMHRSYIWAGLIDNDGDGEFTDVNTGETAKVHSSELFK